MVPPGVRQFDLDPEQKGRQRKVSRGNGRKARRVCSAGPYADHSDDAVYCRPRWGDSLFFVVVLPAAGAYRVQGFQDLRPLAGLPQIQAWGHGIIPEVNGRTWPLEEDRDHGTIPD